MKRLVLSLAALLFCASHALAGMGTAPGQLGPVLGGKLIGANCNSTADQPITITSPTPKYRIFNVLFANSSISVSTASGGLYGGAGKTGAILMAAATTYATLTSAAVNNAGSVIFPSITATAALNLGTVYWTLTTAQGAACTLDIYVYIQPLP